MRTPLARAAGSCPSTMYVMRRVAASIGIQIRGGGPDGAVGVGHVFRHADHLIRQPLPADVGTRHCARWPVRRRRNSARAAARLTTALVVTPSAHHRPVTQRHAERLAGIRRRRR